MDDGITIPPRPNGTDFEVRLIFVSTAIVKRTDRARAVPPRWLTIRGARCENKARLQALAQAGAGWRADTVQLLHW